MNNDLGALSPPERVWWKPLHTEEKVWLGLSLVFALGTWAMMPLWHYVGMQNSPYETYKLTPAQYQERVNAMVEKYAIRDDAGEVVAVKGIPLVHPPAGSDIYLLARQFMWYPILEMEKGKTYRLHFSSIDVLHGFSLYPLNMNFTVYPGYDYVATITPTDAGEFSVLCNEFCGIGHHRMVGRLIVKE
jgi:cytochrome c oxidase subunit 2